MNKLLIITLLVLFSCSKEEYYYCWNCQLFISVDFISELHDFKLCDKTEREISSIEREGTRTDTIGKITIKQVTKCVKVE